MSQVIRIYLEKTRELEMCKIPKVLTVLFDL